MHASVDIEPASFDQLKASPDGAWELIPADWGSFSARLRSLDPDLRLEVNRVTGIFAVVQLYEPERRDADLDQAVGEKGKHLVQTARVLDERLYREVEWIVWRARNEAGGLVKEMRRRRAQRDRDEAHAFDERVGPVAERSVHALRKDLGVKDRAFVPSNSVPKV